MPFARNSDLPDRVRGVLPAAAQSIFRNAFNSAMERGRAESRAFRIAWGAVRNAGFEPGPNGRWRKVTKFERTFDVLKIDEEQRVVFGWASVVEEQGEEVQDSQGDVISSDELENASFDFVMHSREGRAMHKGQSVAQLCASLVFTDQIQKMLDVKLEEVGWLVGFHVDDDEVWERVKAGELPMFSIGGTAESEEEAA